MNPRLSGNFYIFGLVFFVRYSLLGIARQWSREKFAICKVVFDFLWILLGPYYSSEISVLQGLMDIMLARKGAGVPVGTPAVTKNYSSCPA